MLPFEGMIIDYNQDGWGSICLESHLGGGAYGDVFYGVEESTGREVTVKIIRNVDSGLEEYRVKNEASVDVDSEHIVSVLSSKQKEDSPTTWIILFEYFKAEALNDLIDKNSSGLPHFHEYTRQLILALHAAHSSNIIHRDIKPANILISNHTDSSPGTLRVIDFGVSKFRAGESITLTDVPVGTKIYMCPHIEAKGGKTAEFTADLFSFAITVCEMALGAHPWWTPTHKGGIAANVKAQIESGQDAMINSSLFDGRPDLELYKPMLLSCTKFEEGSRIKQWSEVANAIALDLELPSLGSVEFSGKCEFINTSGVNEGGVKIFNLGDRDIMKIGRKEISITNKRLSREHIILMVEDGKLMIADDDSSNGTWLDGEKLIPEIPKEAQDGSKLRMEDVFIEIRF